MPDCAATRRRDLRQPSAPTEPEASPSETRPVQTRLRRRFPSGSVPPMGRQRRSTETETRSSRVRARTRPRGDRESGAGSSCTPPAHDENPTPVKQATLTIVNWTFRTTSPAAAFALPSSRLFGPKPPKYMRTSSSPIAAAYDINTRPRTNRPLRRPSGNTRKTCMKSTGGTRSRACPTVCETPLVAHPSVDTKLTKPPAIISGPKRLSGRRRHAKSPQSTYDSVSKRRQTAITRGAPTRTPTSCPATASANEVAAAAHPTTAIDHESDALGARASSAPAGWATAEALIVHSLLRAGCSRSGRNPSGPTAHASRARTRRKGGVSTTMHPARQRFQTARPHRRQARNVGCVG